MAFRFVGTWDCGYDAQENRLIEFDPNNFGAAVYSSAEGWTVNTLTMTAALSDSKSAPYAANRFLYSIIDGKTFKVDWQISKTGHFDWQPRDHLTCTRRETQ